MIRRLLVTYEVDPDKDKFSVDVQVVKQFENEVVEVMPKSDLLALSAAVGFSVRTVAQDDKNIKEAELLEIALKFIKETVFSENARRVT